MLCGFAVKRGSAVLDSGLSGSIYCEEMDTLSTS